MPAYDSDRFSPAAAVATVSVRSLDSGAVVDAVDMVLDSGADISALPNAVVETLGLVFTDTSYEIMAYDNSLRTCRSVQAEVVFMRGKFGVSHLIYGALASEWGSRCTDQPRYFTAW
jgi:hypothetical protein